MGRRRAPENGEQRTENRARGKRATDRSVGLRCGIFGNHEGPRRHTKIARMRETQICADFGVLAHAGLPVWIYHKEHRDRKGHKGLSVFHAGWAVALVALYEPLEPL